MRKPSPPRDLPPPLELECLKMLWRNGEGGVREVREALRESRNLAYTTVMTLLERLVRRGLVERRKAGRAFIYAPKLDLETARRLALKELVEHYFGGSEEALRQYMGIGHSNGPVRAEPDTELDVSLL